MFEGRAEEAVNLYTSAVPDSAITSLVKYQAGQGGAEGSVQMAEFTLNGSSFKAIDSPAKHQFTFTPSISIFIDCDTEAEIDELYAKLSEGGSVMMPLQEYPFRKKFAWFADKFGVSWQVGLK